MRPATDSAAFLAGFTAAEGCFTGSGSSRFTFSVGLGTEDASSCWAFLAFLGVGHVYSYPPRRSGYDGETTYSVTSLPDLVEVVVPFMDEHLPPSYKQEQYLEWRGRLLDYWEHRARRPPHCREAGCDDRAITGSNICADHLRAR